MPLLTPEEMERYLDPTITQSIHWNRNTGHNPPVTREYVRSHPEIYTKASDSQIVFHRIGPGNEDNEKYIDAAGNEYVFRPHGMLVTDPINKGTFNFGPEPLSAAHVSKDIIPWILWGNGPDDTTTYS